MRGYKNGSSYSRTGSCGLIFSPELVLRPVIFAVHSGYRPDHGTFQVAPVEGDLVFWCSWGSRDTDYGISRADAEGNLRELPIGETPPLWTALHRAHPWTRDWLEPGSGRFGYSIPDEVIPPGDYLATKAKSARIARFERRFGIDLPGAMTAPKGGLNLEPRPIDGGFRSIVPHQKHWTGSMVGIDRSESWYASNGNGDSIPIAIAPDSESGSNWAHSERPEYRDGAPVQYPPGYRYIIRVVWGAYTSNHHSHGVAVDVRDLLAAAQEVAAA